jgi:hypothetical protein
MGLYCTKQVMIGEEYMIEKVMIGEEYMIEIFKKKNILQLRRKLKISLTLVPSLRTTFPL